jgi:hypothetical protein
MNTWSALRWVSVVSAVGESWPGYCQGASTPTWSPLSPGATNTRPPLATRTPRAARMTDTIPITKILNGIPPRSVHSRNHRRMQCLNFRVVHS